MSQIRDRYGCSVFQKRPSHGVRFLHFILVVWCGVRVVDVECCWRPKRRAAASYNAASMVTVVVLPSSPPSHTHPIPCPVCCCCGCCCCWWWWWFFVCRPCSLLGYASTADAVVALIRLHNFALLGKHMRVSFSGKPLSGGSTPGSMAAAAAAAAAVAGAGAGASL
jgi:hypothetical protein